MKGKIEMNELRKDYITDQWVIIAINRGKRPHDFIKSAKDNNKRDITNCPFCSGNEHKTPPAKIMFIKKDGKIELDHDNIDQTIKRRSDWSVRVVQNLYPAVLNDEKTSIKGGSPQNYIINKNAIGDHFVVIDSPNHEDHFHLAEISQLYLTFKMYQELFIQLTKNPEIKYVSLFKNYGGKSGASLTHAHTQIISLPIIPLQIKNEIKALKKKQEALKNTNSNRSIHEIIISHESKSPRFITENASFISFCPYASKTPFEILIYPKKDVINIGHLNDQDLKSLAEINKKVIAALCKFLNTPSYNCSFHQIVDNSLAIQKYRFYLRIIPRLSTMGGFEWNTGIFINTVAPEEAAENIKQLI